MEKGIEIIVSGRLRIEPLSTDNWDQFVILFGKNGACGSCWCMYYRLGNKEFRAGKQEDGNKHAIRKIVSDGGTAGLIGFIDDKPAAWCAFAPRKDFPRLQKSRVHKPVDNKAVWSIPCLFIGKNYRKSGVSTEMIRGAIEYSKQMGISIIEAYPVIPTRERFPDSFVWPGLYSAFERAGFVMVDNKSKNRPMVRYYVQQ